MVVNKFDGLTREPLYGDADGRTVFDLIRQFSFDYEIPPEQIVFTSKKVYERGRVRRQGPADRAADRPVSPRPTRSHQVQERPQPECGIPTPARRRRRVALAQIDPGNGERRGIAQIGQAARRELQQLQEELTHRIETEQRA